MENVWSERQNTASAPLLSLELIGNILQQACNVHLILL